VVCLPKFIEEYLAMLFTYENNELQMLSSYICLKTLQSFNCNHYICRPIIETKGNSIALKPIGAYV